MNYEDTIFPMEPSLKEIEELEDFYAGRGYGKQLFSLAQKMKALDPEYAKLVNEHFWDLISK